jgi:TatD DNase family protein
MLIDSHCHLPTNKNEVDEILKRARNDGVEKVINIGASLQESRQAVEIAESFDNVFASVGVYPHEDKEKSTEQITAELEKMLSQSSKIVAIGECGIDIAGKDYEAPLPRQLELFEAQIQLALKHRLPIVIHNRNADSHVIKILEKYTEHGLAGVAHCFDSTWNTAQQLLNLGFYISFSGFITYTSKQHLLDSVKKVPIDKFLVETDSPWIIPKGVSEKKNEPKNVKMVARTIAEIRNLPLDKVAEVAYENTCRLFKI